MRGIRAGAVVVAVIVAACTATPAASPPSTSARGYPSQPSAIPFPTKEWTRGDWPAEANRPVLDKVVDEAFAGGAAKRVRSVAIVHGGRLIYERYSPNPADGPEVTMPSFSVAKSITCATVGILVREGKLSVTAPAGIPEWTNDPRRAITVDDLLRMSSGLRWTEDTDLPAAQRSRDAARYVAERPLATPPGTTFNYNTGSTYLVDRAMAVALGGSGQFTQFIKAELFAKLGISVTLDYDGQGTWLGGSGAYASTLDYAKFGLLYLRDGVWDGTRVLPAGWVDYSRTPSHTNPSYGSGWWLDPDRPGVFMAIGALGQEIGVDPAHDLTFVITSTDVGHTQPVSAAILTAFASR